MLQYMKYNSKWNTAKVVLCKKIHRWVTAIAMLLSMLVITYGFQYWLKKVSYEPYFKRLQGLEWLNVGIFLPIFVLFEVRFRLFRKR